MIAVADCLNKQNKKKDSKHIKLQNEDNVYCNHTVYSSLVRQEFLSSAKLAWALEQLSSVAVQSNRSTSGPGIASLDVGWSCNCY